MYCHRVIRMLILTIRYFFWMSILCLCNCGVPVFLPSHDHLCQFLLAESTMWLLHTESSWTKTLSRKKKKKESKYRYTLFLLYTEHNPIMHCNKLSEKKNNKNMIQAIQSSICVANGVAAYVDNFISDINAIQYYDSFSEQWPRQQAVRQLLKFRKRA